MTRTFAFRRDSDDEEIYRCVVAANEYRLPDDITGWHVVDIGAHIGSFSRLALDRGATVQAFEGNMENFALLCVNTDCLKCRPHFAVVHGNSASGCDLEVTDFPWPNTGGGNATPKLGSLCRNVHATELETNQIDLLKLDCEGAEFDILTSMHLSTVQRIAMEFHECADPPTWKRASIPHTCEALVVHLEAVGFKVTAVKHGQTGLGKIFASRTTDWPQ